MIDNSASCSPNLPSDISSIEVAFLESMTVIAFSELVSLCSIMQNLCAQNNCYHQNYRFPV